MSWNSEIPIYSFVVQKNIFDTFSGDNKPLFPWQTRKTLHTIWPWRLCILWIYCHQCHPIACLQNRLDPHLWIMDQTLTIKWTLTTGFELLLYSLGFVAISERYTRQCNNFVWAFSSLLFEMSTTIF